MCEGQYCGFHCSDAVWLVALEVIGLQISLFRCSFVLSWPCFRCMSAACLAADPASLGCDQAGPSLLSYVAATQQGPACWALLLRPSGAQACWAFCGAPSQACWAFCELTYSMSLAFPLKLSYMCVLNTPQGSPTFQIRSLDVQSVPNVSRLSPGFRLTLENTTATDEDQHVTGRDSFESEIIVNLPCCPNVNWQSDAVGWIVTSQVSFSKCDWGCWQLQP